MSSKDPVKTDWKKLGLLMWNRLQKLKEDKPVVVIVFNNCGSRIHIKSLVSPLGKHTWWRNPGRKTRSLFP